MKKTLRALLILALTLSLAFVFASCGDDDKGDDQNKTENGSSNEQEKEDTVNTYTVTVVDQNGAPVSGVTVAFNTGAVEVPFPTDAMGIASFEYDGTITAKVIALPQGYTCDKLNKSLTFDKDGNVTVTVAKEATVYYTVKVVDQYGTPIAGVKVQSCDNVGNCQAPRTTDENGEASFKPVDGYRAQLTVGDSQTVSSLYPGYTVDDSEAKYDFVDGVATIVLTKIAE